jgi:hypothetical protein
MRAATLARSSTKPFAGHHNPSQSLLESCDLTRIPPPVVMHHCTCSSTSFIPPNGVKDGRHPPVAPAHRTGVTTWPGEEARLRGQAVPRSVLPAAVLPSRPLAATPAEPTGRTPAYQVQDVCRVLPARTRSGLLHLCQRLRTLPWFPRRAQPPAHPRRPGVDAQALAQDAEKRGWIAEAEMPQAAHRPPRRPEVQPSSSHAPDHTA